MRVLKNTWLWFALTVVVAASAYFWLVAQQPALPSLEGQQETRAGSVQALSSPTGAEITLDGKVLDQTSPAEIDGVKPGTHTVKFTLTGYEEKTVSVVLSPGRTAWAQTELAPQ